MSTSTFFSGGSKYSDFVEKLSSYEDGQIAKATSEAVLELLVKCNGAISDKNCTKNEIVTIFEFLDKCNKNSSNIAIKIETIELENKCLTKLGNAPVNMDVTNLDIAMIPKFQHFDSIIKQQIVGLDGAIAIAFQQAFKATKENWVSRKTGNKKNLEEKKFFPMIGKFIKTVASSMAEEDVATRIERFDNFAKSISNRTDGLKMATDVMTFLDNLGQNGVFSRHVDSGWTFLSMFRENLLKEMGVYADDLGSKKDEMLLFFGHAIHADQTKNHSNDQSANLLFALDLHCRNLNEVAARAHKSSVEFKKE